MKRGKRDTTLDETESTRDGKKRETHCRLRPSEKSATKKHSKPNEKALILNREFC
jgi:hypothetical protein